MRIRRQPGGTLGYRGPAITPLVELKSLIEERVGGGEGWGGFLRMNPRVDDIPEQFGIAVDGVRVLVMGTIERGKRGCACPENILLREVLNICCSTATSAWWWIWKPASNTWAGARPRAWMPCCSGGTGMGQPGNRGPRSCAGARPGNPADLRHRQQDCV